MPESKAEEKNTKTIQVTYKAGIGTGEDVTVNQEVCDSQTQGENDYTDGKIVLYRNGENGLNFMAEQIKYEANNVMYDRILTGWKLTSVMKNGIEITNYLEPENQNYADKTNANKDIGTVYAQEGWYIVPDGVTAITVEAVYARAIYVRSPFDKMYYDEVHCFYYGENSDGTTTLDGTAVAKSSDDNDGSTVEKAVSTLRRAYELMSENNIQTVNLTDKAVTRIANEVTEILSNESEEKENCNCNSCNCMLADTATVNVRNNATGGRTTWCCTRRR